MAFCSKCGNEVRPNDRFCKKCGTPQSFTAGAETSASDPLRGMEPHMVAALCYLPFLGWIAAIYVLSAKRFVADRERRFHAFQGLFLFVAWLVYDWVLEGIVYEILPQPWYFSRVIKLGFTVGWVWLLWQTSQRQTVRIPFLSELADKSVEEQGR
ncbi:MAG: zinc-ribbon domain-containing protein [Bryobacter sp.]|nr:zinc-ribbon domain-containing protein [Bryobacter sp.]